MIADGPKDKEEQKNCLVTRKEVEKKIDWDCQVEKIYSETNLGCARRVQTGLDTVFKRENSAIILEDDTLPHRSFFNFCEVLLRKYKHEENIYHISGCNFYPSTSKEMSSYCISSIVNIWGWATWSRAWSKYDLKMKSWEKQNKEEFLEEWCSHKKVRKDTLKMFDLHCNNQDPWTWDYQWVYACWENKGLSIIPKVNLVQNIGFGPEGTHTKFELEQGSYPRETNSLSFPLTHPENARNISFESEYFKNQTPSIFQITKLFLKKIFHWII